MLSIGELAYRAGVSRRMLRHWEEAGLLTPAEVDRWTGHRRYAPRQAGRVRAIAALRAVGFKLDAIGDLLSSGLSERRLVDLLRSREAELEAQISEASTWLQEVRSRLTSLEEGHHIIMNTLELGPLPALELAALQTIVDDESEIGEAVRDLLAQLRDRLGEEHQNVTLAYDGSTDRDLIMVTAGITVSPATDPIPGLKAVVIAGSDRGATVRYVEAPPDVGDSWIALDAALETYALATTGVYRQTISSQGAVVLQAPVVPLAE